MQQLQEIADALNGSPEAQNCKVSPSKVFQKDIIDNIPKTKPLPTWNDTDDKDIIFKIYIDPQHGLDKQSNGLSIDSPLKTIQFALNKLRKLRNNTNNRNKAMMILREGIFYLNSTINLDENDSNLIITNHNGENVVISGAIPLINRTWNPTPKNNQIFVTQLDGFDIFDGLRVNGARAVRARYPNANPELDGFGSSLLATDWFLSIIPPVPETEIYSMPYPMRNDSATNEFVYYQAGIGGICNAFDPPMGYWCGTRTVCLHISIRNERHVSNA